MLRDLLSYLEALQMRFTYRQRYLFFVILYVLLVPFPAYWAFKTLDFQKKGLEWIKQTNAYQTYMGQILAQIGEYAILDSPSLNEKDPLRDRHMVLKQAIIDNFAALKKIELNMPYFKNQKISDTIQNKFNQHTSSLESLWNQIISHSLTLDYATYKKLYRNVLKAGLEEQIFLKKIYQNTEDGSALSILLTESSYQQLPETILPALEIIWLMEENQKLPSLPLEPAIRLDSWKELLNQSYNQTKRFVEDTYFKADEDKYDLYLSQARKSLSRYLNEGEKFLDSSQNADDIMGAWRSGGINLLEANQESQKISTNLLDIIISKQLARIRLLWDINLLAFLSTFLLLLAYSYWKILSGHLNLLQDHIEDMRKGIFNTCFSSHSNDEFGKIGRLLDKVAHSIQARSKALHTFLQELTDSSQKIATTTDEQKVAMRGQKNHLQDIEDIANKIASNASDLSQVIQQLIQSSMQKDLVERAKESLNEMQRKMSDLVRASSTIVTDLHEVENKVSSTTRLTTFLSRASNKANLLSLNAAIETANIGLQQKDFAEISLKIQRFANNTARSTKDIQQIIQEISLKVKDVRHEADSCLKEISEGAHRLIDVSQQLAHITQQGKEQISQFETVNEMTLQQVHAAENIVESIREMDKTTTESTAAIDELTQTVERLTNTSADIQKVLEMFTKSKDSINE